MLKKLTVPELIQIIFLILKLLKVIKWKWIWVLCPMWITAILIIIATIIQLIKDKKDGYR